MRKTLIILTTVALLGMLAAFELPAGIKQSASATVSKSTSTAPSSTTSSQTSIPVSTASRYKDGSFTGSLAINRFDEIQVAVVIVNGKITDVTTLTLNGDSGRSEQINNYAAPELKQQVLSAQSASIDGVSGASYTSQSYTESLQAALDQAKA